MNKKITDIICKGSLDKIRYGVITNNTSTLSESKNILKDKYLRRTILSLKICNINNITYHKNNHNLFTIF